MTARRLELSDREKASWARRLAEPPALPAGASAPGAAGVPAAGGMGDDAAAAYVAEVREPFDLLCQAEAQLAGLMVLAAASGRAVAGHPMLALASDAIEQATDALRAIRPPGQGAHHHEHVLTAARTIGRAAAAARRCVARGDDRAVDAVMAPLKSAHRHLLWATAALPGLQVVALAEACCARHAANQRANERER